MGNTWRRSVLTSTIVLLALLLYLPGTANLTPFVQYDDTIWTDVTDTIPTGDDEPEDVEVVTPSEGVSFGIGEKCTCPNRFSSYDELSSFVEDAKTSYNDFRYRGGFAENVGGGWWGGFLLGTSMATADMATLDYSTTNIQVEGVDEPDIVKTDGEYLYVVSKGEVTILRAYPGEDAEILSRITTERGIKEIFVLGTRLVIFEGTWWSEPDVLIFDISSKSSPAFVTNVSISGRYVDSRMIGDYVYVIASQHLKHYSPEGYTLGMPEISSGNSTTTVKPWEICYFDGIAPDFVYTMIVSINLRTEEVEYGVFLTDSTREIYVSKENIYLASYSYRYWMDDSEGENREMTSIHKISIDEGTIEYVAEGEVPGRTHDQFSMDEHEGYFRIATTEGHVGKYNPTSTNNVFVLDQDLEIVGRLENLAPGEMIYSSRFMGDRCYLVTFKKIDPFFVIDLSNATNPQVLGKLKIPGYSDYLHPYDENHIIGLGKETVEAQGGNFAWYQGVKLSLFDVTDVSNPIEVSKYIIGDRGTTSEALYDHKAFMFSRSKNLLIIPIKLAKIDPSKYPNGVPPNTHGDIVWNGACVFSLTLDAGFQPKGGISHADELPNEGYRWWSSYTVRRSLYIEDYVYTISENLVKINRMDDLAEIGELEL